MLPVSRASTDPPSTPSHTALHDVAAVQGLVGAHAGSGNAQQQGEAANESSPS